MVHNVATVPQRAQAFKRFPNRHQVDGVLILSLSPSDDDLRHVLRADVPVVLIDADHHALTDIHRIVVDDVAGGRAATEHLVGLGHRRIGFVGDFADNPFHFTSSRDRALGFREALEAAAIPFRGEYAAEGEHDLLEARRLAAAMLKLPEPPTAIFAASDTQAFGVMEAARDLGLRVPEDLSVVGYDDIEMAAVLGLTTVRQPLYQSGKLGMELLLELLANPHTPPRRRLLPTELVIRQSTAAPRMRPLLATMQPGAGVTRLPG